MNEGHRTINTAKNHMYACLVCVDQSEQTTTTRPNPKKNHEEIL